MGHEILTPEQICERFQISNMTLFRWRKTGKFPKSIQTEGRLLRWRLEDIENFERTGEVEMIQLGDKDWKEMESRTTVKWTSTAYESLKDADAKPEDVQREIRAQLGLSLDAKDIEVLGAILDTKLENQKLKIIVRKIRGLLK